MHKALVDKYQRGEPIATEQLKIGPDHRATHRVPEQMDMVEVVGDQDVAQICREAVEVIADVGSR